MQVDELGSEYWQVSSRSMSLAPTQGSQVITPGKWPLICRR